MSFDCIITQGHIPDFDPQGSLNWEQKVDAFQFSLQRLRDKNRHSYIIATGHGKRPNNLGLCDWVYWEDECRPIDERGLVIGMPAQYFFVSKGIERALAMGFSRCLKTRMDCFSGIPNIVNWCDEEVNREGKTMLLTQQTGDNFIGDCFMYGGTELMHGIWNKDNPATHPDGLVHTYNSMSNFLGKEMTRENLRPFCAFRDVLDLKMVCLRWNYDRLKKMGWDRVCHQDDNGTFDYHLYNWGRANKWHVWDKEGKLIINRQQTWTKEEFYR